MFNYSIGPIIRTNVPFRGVKTIPIKKEVKKYTDTIKLPRTRFPLWLNSFKAVERDKHVIQASLFD